MKEKIYALIAKQLKVDLDKVTDDARLVEDLGADSANLMVLLMDMEDTFDIQVEDAAIVTIKTAGDVARYVEDAQG